MLTFIKPLISTEDSKKSTLNDTVERKLFCYLSNDGHVYLINTRIPRPMALTFVLYV